MDKTLKILVFAGLGYGIWMLYKHFDPECVHDMKEKVSTMAQKATKKVENMM